jgi:hypothetical protein
MAATDLRAGGTRRANATVGFTRHTTLLADEITARLTLK